MQLRTLLNKWKTRWIAKLIEKLDFNSADFEIIENIRKLVS